MQTDEQIRQSVPLRLSQYGQEFGTADEDQRSDFVEDIEEHNRNGDQSPQNHHQHGMMFVDPFEQAVKSQNQKDRNGLVEQFQPYANAE